MGREDSRLAAYRLQGPQPGEGQDQGRGRGGWGVGKYIIRPLLSLERLSLDEREGKFCYRHGKGAAELERMDYLEFIARVTSPIPDKGYVMVRYYGPYANGLSEEDQEGEPGGFFVVDRIIIHLKLTFIADKPPPARIACQELLVAATTGGEYFS